TLGQRESAVIAADAVDQAALEASPECCLRIAVAERWCHQVAGGVGPRVERVIEDQIVGTRLRQGGYAVVTSLCDQVHCQRGRQVDEVDGAAGGAAEEQSAADRFGLGHGRPGLRMEGE